MGSGLEDVCARIAVVLESGCLSELRELIVSGQLVERTATAALWHALQWTPTASLVPACAHLLVHAGADAAAPNANGQTALHLAAMRGHVDALALLLALGGKASDTLDHDGRTALHVAAIEADARSVHALLAAGARRFRRDRWQRTPLGCLSTGQRDSLLVVELLCVQNRSACAIAALPASRAPRKTRAATTQTGEEPRAASAQHAMDGPSEATEMAPDRCPAQRADAVVAHTKEARGALKQKRDDPSRFAAAVANSCTLGEQPAGGDATRWAARDRLELAAAEAGVPLPAALVLAAAPTAADALAPADARLLRLANALRAHVRQAEVRQARLNRAEARVRDRLFELVGLQLAAAARVRAANRSLRARLARSQSEVGAARASASEASLPASFSRVLPPPASPPSPGTSRRMPRPKVVPRGEAASAPASPPTAESARERALDHDRLALLLELRRRDLDEREELLRGSEQRLEDQRVALCRLLRVLDHVHVPQAEAMSIEPSRTAGSRSWERVAEVTNGSYASPESERRV
jgi:hypothetical protein